MMKLRNHFEPKHTTVRLTSLLGIGLVVLFSTSCALTKPTITPNAYSKNVGKKQMKADEDACREYGTEERERLLQELLTGDQKLANDLGREAAANSTAHSMAKAKGSSSAKADAVGFLAELALGSWDEEALDEELLAKYLGVERKLSSGFRASQRLKHICLRRKGYKVVKYEEDGTGIPHLERKPYTRVLLREADGSEKVFYEHIPPSHRDK